MFIDIQWFIIRFTVWFVDFVQKIKRNVEKIYLGSVQFCLIHFIVIDKPQSLNTLTICFFFLSISVLGIFLNIPNPSSRYQPMFSLLVIFFNLIKIYVPTSSQTSASLLNLRWQLKNNNFNYSIKWSIALIVYGHANPLSCKLCLMEKYWITKYFDDPNLLNKKSELINKCRHQNKTLLRNVKRQYIFAIFM